MGERECLEHAQMKDSLERRERECSELRELVVASKAMQDECLQLRQQVQQLQAPERRPEFPTLSAGDGDSGAGSGAPLLQPGTSGSCQESRTFEAFEIEMPRLSTEPPPRTPGLCGDRCSDRCVTM